jgi:hypothetical protein
MQTQYKKFDAAMLGIYQRAKSEAGYTPTLFLQMLYDRGGFDTARYLINTRKPSEGYLQLYKRGRLDLTVEALVVENPEWHDLFTPDELEKARRRLTEYRYSPKQPSGGKANILAG